MRSINYAMKVSVVTGVIYGLLATATVWADDCVQLDTPKRCAAEGTSVPVDDNECVEENCGSDEPVSCVTDDITMCDTGTTQSLSGFDKTVPGGACTADLICTDDQGAEFGCESCEVDTETACRKGEGDCPDSE